MYNLYITIVTFKIFYKDEVLTDIITAFEFDDVSRFYNLPFQNLILSNTFNCN